MNVKIEIIDHKDHRYPTVGDWFFDDNGDLTIRVSKLSSWRAEMLIAVHELIEVLCCKNDGVTQKQVDDFDMEFEKNREDNDCEPGDEPAAPYCDQHCFATGIERMLAAYFKLSWKLYENELDNLP